MTSPATAPNPTLTIKLDDKPIELFMAFGMLNNLARIVGSFERLAEVDFDAGTRTAIVETALTPRDALGRANEADAPNLFGLSVEDAEAILDWVKAHLADFFLGRFEKQLRALENSKERLTGVGLSLSGLALSASKTPSSSP